MHTAKNALPDANLGSEQPGRIAVPQIIARGQGAIAGHKQARILYEGAGPRLPRGRLGQVETNSPGLRRIPGSGKALAHALQARKIDPHGVRQAELQTPLLSVLLHGQNEIDQPLLLGRAENGVKGGIRVETSSPSA
jgi:hypothetical protein